MQNLIWAGDKPNQFSSGKSDIRDILVKWGNLAQKTLKQYGKLPVISDWKINRLRPTVSGIMKDLRNNCYKIGISNEPVKRERTLQNGFILTTKIFKKSPLH